ncbi:type 4b pilus protein PilO2 [Ralstonia sp. ASV6]|uniref:type 4b pilus protein PilO2 n=1 Tax=Ralstonia sp. ASV6 TaxID=2795124 RepID=UPI0018EC6B18|nr:type 4b pilus protein PilO2 [Ralstonia sp. ASV6]
MGKWKISRLAPGSKARAKRQEQRIDLNIEIVEIGGRKFVAGMHWQELSSKLKYRAEAKRIGGQRHWNVVAFRRNEKVIQAGFVSSEKGAYKGMYSFAAALDGEIRKRIGGRDTWLGAFKLPDGRYLIEAAWEGSLIATGDTVVDRDSVIPVFNEIRNTFEKDNEKFPSDCLFAPPEFDLAPQELELGDLLGPKASLSKEYKLTALRFALTPAEVRLLIGGCLILAVALTGFDRWQHHQQELREKAEQAEAARRQAELARANADARKKLEEEALRHPWATQPSAEDYALACYGVVSRLPLNIAGWDFQTAECEGESAKVNYVRAVGTTQAGFGATVSKQLAALGGSDDLSTVSFTDNGDMATILLPVKAPVAGDDALLSKKDAAAKFLVSLEASISDDQRVIDNLTMREVPVVIQMPPPDPATTPPGTPPPQPPQATWRRFDYSFKSMLPPDDVLKGMQLKQGLRIAKIKTSLNAKEASLIWDFSGEMYVQR